MNKKNFTTYSLITLLLLMSFALLFSCSNPTEPEPGNRNYTWSVDTLKIGEYDAMSLYGIWGSGPDDVWAAGISNDLNYGTWHFNGLKWTNFRIHNQYLNPFAIIGLAKNDIWLGGMRGEMWHYDGREWQYHSSYMPEGGNFAHLSSFIKTGEKELFGCGAASVNGEWLGVIVKYDGVKWELLDVPKVNYSFTSMAKLDNNGTFLISGYNSTVTVNQEQLYLFKDSKTTIVKEGNSHYLIRTINKKNYVINDGKIYRYENEKLKLWKDFSNTSYIGRLWGRNENDMFTFNEDGIGHYNGIELQTIYNFENCYIRNAAIFEKDVFFILQEKTNSNHRIVHGILE